MKTSNVLTAVILLFSVALQLILNWITNKGSMMLKIRVSNLSENLNLICNFF